MKFLRIAPFVVSALLAQPCFAREAVLMRRTFVNDSVEQFKVTTEMNMKFKIDSEEFVSSQNLSNDRIFKFSKVDSKGNAEFVSEDLNYKGTETIDGESSKIQDPESYDSSYSAKVNPLMVITDIEPKEKPSKSKEEEEPSSPLDDIFDALNVSMLAYQLPEKTVEVGDEWKIALPADEYFKAGQFVLGKFKGLVKWNDQDVFMIEYSTNASVKPDMSKLAGEGEDAEMLKGAELTGELVEHIVLYLNPKDFSIMGTTDDSTVNVQLKLEEFEMSYEIKAKEESVRVTKS